MAQPTKVFPNPKASLTLDGEFPSQERIESRVVSRYYKFHPALIELARALENMVPAVIELADTVESSAEEHVVHAAF